MFFLLAATPEVYVTPHLQSRRPGEVAEIACSIIGEPVPYIKWMKNDETIQMDGAKASSKYEFVGNGSTIRIKNIQYADTGAYMCAATSIGGAVRDLSSLIVQDDPTPTILANDRKFFVFHADGVSIYDSTLCRMEHQIFGGDLIMDSDRLVCGPGLNDKCVWGHAINIGDNDLDGETSNNGMGLHLIYIAQPYLNRVLVISTLQMIVIDVVETQRFPLNLHYVPTYDQIWVLNWQWTAQNAADDEFSTKNPAKVIQVIRNVRQTHQKHYAVYPQTIDGKYDLVMDLFIPSADIKDNIFTKYYSYKYGYVTHHNQRGIYKLNMATLRYVRYIDLTLYNCVPAHIEFSGLCEYL